MQTHTPPKHATGDELRSTGRGVRVTNCGSAAHALAQNPPASTAASPKTQPFMPCPPPAPSLAVELSRTPLGGAQKGAESVRLSYIDDLFNTPRRRARA